MSKPARRISNSGAHPPFVANDLLDQVGPTVVDLLSSLTEIHLATSLPEESPSNGPAFAKRVPVVL